MDISVYFSLFWMCHSKIDPYGFERPDNFDAGVHEEFMSEYLGVLARRAGRWSRYMRGRKRVSKSAKCTIQNSLNFCWEWEMAFLLLI